MHFFFDIPPESPTVRGYAAILEEGLRDTTPEEVLRVPDDFYLNLGLHKVLTPQRMRGMAAMLSYMKHLALLHTA
jgi:cysteine desulfuration protein SufE